MNNFKIDAIGTKKSSAIDIIKNYREYLANISKISKNNPRASVFNNYHSGVSHNTAAARNL